MVCQFRVRTCTDRTRATGARVRLRLFERTVDAGARDLPYACNARQTITASKGGRVPGSSSRPPAGQRAFALQRLDLGVEQLVVHGDLAHLGFQPGDLVVAVIAFAFFQGCSRTCERTLAPLA